MNPFKSDPGLESELADLSTLVESLQTQLTATQTALEAGSVSDAAIAAAIKVVQDNQATLDAAVAAVTAAQTALADAQSADTATITAAQTAADEAAEALADSVAELADELTALGETNAELKTVTDLINEAVALLTTNQAINTDAIADLVDAVAALDTDNNALSSLINTLSSAVTSNTQEILDAILAGNNVYSPDANTGLVINSPASLDVALSLGTKLGIVNGGVNITNGTSNSLDATKLQKVMDYMVTVTGVVTYTHSGDGPAANFSKLSSAGEIAFDVEQAVSLPELTTVTNEFGLENDNKVTSFSAPKLKTVGTFNGSGDILELSRATSIDLSSLTYYDGDTQLTITGNGLSAGWDLDMPDFQTKTSAGVTRGSFTLTIGGYVNLVELDKMTSSVDTIAAPLANKVVLDNFNGTLTGNHVDVTLGAAKKNYTGGTRLEKANITGVLTSSSTTADAAEGPTFDFDNATKLISATISGEANDISFDGNTNVETINISANAVKIGFNGATSLTSATISGDLRGDIDFTGATSLTEATLSGSARDVTFSGNTALTSITMTGSANQVVLTGASVLTSAVLAYTTASELDQTKGTALAATGQAGSLHVYNNAELVSLSADNIANIGSLKVYKNPNLTSVSFDGISAPAAAYTGKTEILVGATTNSNAVTVDSNTKNKLFAQSIVETEAVDLADGSDRATATITTNSGLADLAAMITAARADSKNDVAVFFDGIDSYTTLAGSTTTDRTYANDATKVTIANFATLTNADDTANIILQDRKSEAFTIDDDITLTYNGKTETFDASSYDTEALYLAALEAQSTIDGVSISTGKIDQQGRVAITTAGTAVVTAIKVILGDTSKAATYTSTSEIFITVAPTLSNTDSSTNASEIASALNDGEIGVYSGTVGTVSATIDFDKKYKAIAYDNSIAIVPVKKIETADEVYEYVVDRTAAPLDFMIYDTSSNGIVFSSIHTERTNYFVQLKDTAENSSTIGDGAITGNDISYNNISGSSTVVNIAVDKTYVNGSFTFNITSVPYTNGLTITSEYYADGADSNARTLAADADVYFNTTYYTWN